MALDFFAGCLGGAAGVVVGHPLDTVKVRLQTQSPTNIKYRGTFHCLTTIVKQESISGLYKGISSPLFGVAGVNALIFGVYGSLRPYVSGSPGNDALWAHFAAGSISGAVQSVIASPMELVKTRLQISEDVPGAKKLGPVEVLKGIYRNEGGMFRGVFKGWGITLAREIPGFGFYFASYEALTRIGDGQVGTLGMMLAGGMAGVVSWIVTFPIDVVKTRLQCDSSGKYRGIVDCVRQTLNNEGYRAFTRGLVSTVIRAFPTNAATFTVVTWIMRLAEGPEEDPTQNTTAYLNELIRETSQLQEKFEDSLRLKLPQYFLCGSSLTSCSLASQCASSAQNYASKTQVYFNFYQSLKEQLEEEERNFYQSKSELASEAESDKSSQDKKGSLSLRDRLARHEILHSRGSEINMQGQENLIFVSSSSSGSISRFTTPAVSKEQDEEEKEGESSDHNRNSDDSVQRNNHILSNSTKSLSSLSVESRRILNQSERETNLNPVNNTVSCLDENGDAQRVSDSNTVNTAYDDDGNDNDNSPNQMKNCSLLRGNEMFSHEATLLPADSHSRVAALSDKTATGADAEEGERNAGQLFVSSPTSAENNNNQARPFTSEGLDYLSKSLDIPNHIMEVAVAMTVTQQSQKEKATQAETNDNESHKKKETKNLTAQKSQKKAPSVNKQRKDNGSVAEAWRSYCNRYKYNANLCKCFEDHCVCYF